MTKIGMAEQQEGLASYELGYANGAMYATVHEPAWIQKSPFWFNGRQYAVGRVFTTLGTKDRRMFKIQDGHWLEYAGRIESLLLFKADGEERNGWYYAFYEVGGRLLIVNLDGSAYDVW